MNYIDAVCIIILLAYMQKGRRKGAVFISLLSKLVSMAASLYFCGAVSSMLRKTAIFDFFKQKAIIVLSLDSVESAVNDIGSAFISEIISELFGGNITANNNPEIYKLFGVDKFTDYIASYIANTAINIISVLLVFFCVSVIIKTTINVFSLFSSLPGIKQANGLVNAALGVCHGVIIIWIIMVIVVFFALQGVMTNVYTDIISSTIGARIFEHNVFIKIIFSVIY